MSREADRVRFNSVPRDPEVIGGPSPEEEPTMPDEQSGPGDKHVSTRGIVAIAAYLLLFTALTFVGIVWQWPECDLTCKDNTGQSTAGDSDGGANTNGSANANAGAPNTNSGANANNANANARPSNSPAPTPPVRSEAVGATEQARADMDSAEPASGSVNGNTQVTIKGKGFTEGVVVKFDGITARVTRVSNESVSLRTPCHEEGVVDIAIYRKGKEQGRADDVLPNAYTYTCPAPSGKHLFVLIILAGMLGGILHAARSLWWYVGHRDLRWSWVLMYILLPFIGAAMALVFYLIIIAGFLPNAPSKNATLFVLATAALVGMFSQQAALKLTDIANALFSKPASGSEARPQKSLPASAPDAAETTALTANKMSRLTGTTAGGDEVTITGTGFSDATTVTFDRVTAAIKPGSVSPTSITVLTPAHAAEEVEVEVKSGNQSAKLPVKFKYE